MTLDDLEHQNRVLCIFLAILGCDQVYIIHQVAPRNYCYVIQIKNLVFVY